jgi:hypothetical protein
MKKSYISTIAIVAAMMAVSASASPPMEVASASNSYIKSDNMNLGGAGIGAASKSVVGVVKTAAATPQAYGTGFKLSLVGVRLRPADVGRIGVSPPDGFLKTLLIYSNDSAGVGFIGRKQLQVDNTGQAGAGYSLVAKLARTI